MKTIELLKIREGLSKFDQKKDLPAKAIYAISRNQHKIDEALEPYEETRIKLVQKYGKKVEGDKYVINGDNKEPEKFEGFMKEITEIQQAETEDIKFATISIKDIEKLSMSLEDMNAIYFMIGD